MLEYPELGMEAIWRIEVEDFPAFIVIDDKGNDFFSDLKIYVTAPVEAPGHAGWDRPGADGALAAGEMKRATA